MPRTSGLDETHTWRNCAQSVWFHTWISLTKLRQLPEHWAVGFVISSRFSVEGAMRESGTGSSRLTEGSLGRLESKPSCSGGHNVKEQMSPIKCLQSTPGPLVRPALLSAGRGVHSALSFPLIRTAPIPQSLVCTPFLRDQPVELLWPLSPLTHRLCPSFAKLPMAHTINGSCRYHFKLDFVFSSHVGLCSLRNVPVWTRHLPPKHRWQLSDWLVWRQQWQGFVSGGLLLYGEWQLSLIFPLSIRMRTSQSQLMVIYDYKMIPSST